MNIYDKLNLFMQSTKRNTWIENSIMKVYVRKSNRLIKGSYIKTFDIAVIEVFEKFRGKGYFRKFMQQVEKIINLPIFFECIHNKQLQYMLVKNDYTLIVNEREIHAIKFGGTVKKYKLYPSATELN